MTPIERDASLARLLALTNFADAERLPLAGDASTRRYERLIGADGARAILMDAPRNAESPPCPPTADAATRAQLGWNALSRLAASRVEAFAAVAEHLRSTGLSAPAILGVDAPAGYAIVEDLGDALFAQAIPDGADEVQLYCAAADVLVQLHAEAPPATLPGPDGDWPLLDYDAVALRANADLFVEWMPRYRPEIRIDDAARARWERTRDTLIAEAETFPRAFTIRDYHAENLIWLPERDGVRRVGLLDFQDALRGWPAWDFAMLLQDARRDVSQIAAEAAVARYLRRTGMEEALFRRQLAVLGALNALRILGIFARLVVRDGKARYESYVPRMWGRLGANLRHPGLGDLDDLIGSLAAPFLERFS